MPIPAHDDVLIPLMDSWGVSDDAGTWIVRAGGGLDDAAWRRWAIATLTASLAELGEVFRSREIVLRTDAGEVTVEPPLPQRAGVIAEQLERPLRQIEAQLDVRAWVRPATDADSQSRTLVEGWLRLPTELVIMRLSPSGNSEIYLRMHHTLFCADDLRAAEPNDVLFARNAPRLGEALRRWERVVGTIVEVEGRARPFRYGFADLPPDEGLD